MRRLILLLFVVFAGFRAGPAAAEILGDARVPFTADRALTVDGNSIPGKIFHTPGLQRHEVMLLGMRQTVILDARTASGWFILPFLKSYVPFTFAPAAREMDVAKLRKTRVREETVNGVPTTQYKIAERGKDGTEVSGFAWISAEGIVMRLDGTAVTPHSNKPTDFRMELSNVQRGPQDPGLFVLPDGLNKLPFEALQGFVKPLTGVQATH